LVLEIGAIAGAEEFTTKAQRKESDPQISQITQIKTWFGFLICVNLRNLWINTAVVFVVCLCVTSPPLRGDPLCGELLL
jgi:hypothetical protein